MATVEWDDYPKLPTKLQYYGEIFSKRFVDPRSKLYPTQKQALRNLVEWFGNEEKKNLTAVVVMPTGSGKTGVICCLPFMIGGAIAEEQISSEEIDITKPVLIIAPGIDILNQLKSNLVTAPFLAEKGLLTEKDKEANYSVLTIQKACDVTDLQPHGFDIILSNSQKWRKQKDGTPNYEDLPNDLFSMVIVDEAHHLPATQWQEIITKFCRHAKIVFFTATPDRCDERPITTDGAIKAVGYAYKLTREDAIKAKLIRDVEIDSLSDSSLAEGVGDMANFPPAKRIKTETPVKRRSSSRDVAYNFEKRMEYAAKVLKQVIKRMKEKNDTLPLPGKKKHTSIIITRDIDDADAVKDICIYELEFPAGKVGLVNTAEIKSSKSKRNKELEKIKSGRYEIVIIMKMLLEGFDHPPFSIAGIVTRIKSPVKFAQFIGRIQRVVRHKKEDDTTEVEENIKGDIITHDYFDQKKLF